jgi:2-phospho-L-lactate guanylyltransferase
VNLQRTIWAVVPVKQLDRSKGRLAPLLSRQERHVLARVMLMDVLQALRQSRGLAGVTVVTRDAEVAAMAAACEARIMTDQGSDGMTSAIVLAARHLQNTIHAGMLIVPADVPGISPRDIETLIDAHAAPTAVTLAPAERDGGTNLLLCTPPEAIPFHYGEGSCARHQQAARERGIAPRTIRIEGAALDLDRPEDIADFMRVPSGTQTYAWLVSNGIGTRVRARLASSASDPRFQPSYTS